MSARRRDGCRRGPGRAADVTQPGGIFVSTTWSGETRTDLGDVLDAMAGMGFDGVELGSTHLWRDDLATVVAARCQTRIFTHNYFPPAAHDLVIDLAAADDAVRQASLDHCRACIDFAAEIGAAVYTVHPGYVVAPEAATLSRGRNNFDFAYSNRRSGHDAALKRMNQSLADLADAAGSRGVVLAIETQGSVTSPDVSLLERIDDYDAMFAVLGRAVALNFNLAHTAFAARVHGYGVESFVRRYREHFVAVELSHNDGTGDQHRPLIDGSPALQWAERLSDLPLILEFRNARRSDIEASLALVRRACISSVHSA